ncbi:amidohydrolase family protein [Gordonia desulfuricans]|uniref:Amidohydrolase family protein n=1 Tax=Gordonia desulfuricans TaxID=89051 RepID=A0A7K3LN88_9ACTN|nr:MULTISPECIES: amidohydrolase family protein [Gordonia]KOY49322.1 hypothetical protein ISGA_10920 [Gordonia sp. NB41Y]NDK89705.1 amidohydrolase family protein [Gordonia desulfuricans]WLP89709.1 amidohydrolase family protein [Gordonia sp. NB41Y]
MDAGVVIERADLGRSATLDIRIARAPGGDRVIDAVGAGIRRPGDEVVDAAGAAVIPAFTDHHLHLHAMAAVSTSVHCGPPTVTDRTALATALHTAPAGPDGWVRGVGYVESVAGDLTTTELDRIEPGRPVRIQHRSGALWMLNTAALRAAGIVAGSHPGVEVDAEGLPTGRVWRADDWLRWRLPRSGPPDLTDVGRRLHDLGIVESTDATPDLDEHRLGALIRAVDDGLVTGRLHLLGVPVGRRLDHPRITVGPYKIVIADSDLPDLDDLVARIAAAHADHRSVAVHCVSRVAFALLLAAWEIAGVRPGDRIEHAGMVPAEGGELLARLGVVVVTQPGFLPHRGDDFLDGTPQAEHADLYRCGSLIRAGVPVALSSDAPYGPLDPWQTIAAATERRTASGRVVGDTGERIGVAQAVAAHCTPAARPDGPPRRVQVGDPGDLLILDRPWADVVAAPGDVRVDRVTATR